MPWVLVSKPPIFAMNYLFFEARASRQIKEGRALKCEKISVCGTRFVASTFFVGLPHSEIFQICKNLIIFIESPQFNVDLTILK